MPNWTPTERGGQSAGADDELVVIELDSSSGTTSTSQVVLGARDRRDGRDHGRRSWWWGAAVVTGVVVVAVAVGRLQSSSDETSPPSTTNTTTTTVARDTTVPTTEPRTTAPGRGASPEPLLDRTVNWYLFARVYNTPPELLIIDPNTGEADTYSYPDGFARQVLLGHRRLVVLSDNALYDRVRRFELVDDSVQHAAMNADGLVWYLARRTLFISPDRGAPGRAVAVGATSSLPEGSDLIAVTSDGDAVVRLPDERVVTVDESGGVTEIGADGWVVAADSGGYAAVTCNVDRCTSEMTTWSGARLVLEGRVTAASFPPSANRVMVEFSRGGRQVFDMTTGDLLRELARGSGAWAPDGSAYITTSQGGGLVLVDLERVDTGTVFRWDQSLDIAAVG